MKGGTKKLIRQAVSNVIRHFSLNDERIDSNERNE